ncbi:MAG: YHS domain-containing protein [Gemmatimonadota bacterium]|nr:YHS domain-containing protein [Gemmatimonadota bacterium]
MMILWVLLLAGLFLVMMRVGCGAHMAHAGHQDAPHPAGHIHGPTDHGAPPAESAVDPVCGMPVAVDQGYAEVYQGRLLRFCSRRCLDTFDAAPQRYAA